MLIIDDYNNNLQHGSPYHVLLTGEQTGEKFVKGESKFVNATNNNQSKLVKSSSNESESEIDLTRAVEDEKSSPFADKSLCLTENANEKALKHESETNNEVIMLTTVDNPYDPFTQFELWRGYDESMGYYTMEYLARIAKTSDSLSETDETIEIQSAIDKIVKLNVLGIYRKIKR